MKQALPDFNLFYDSPAEAEKIEAYARAGALGMLKARVIYDGGIIIKAGSRFEMSGDLYTLDEDKTFSLPAGDEWDRYIYFDGTSFSIVSTTPTFKAGGWYNGSNRALIKVRAQFGCVFWSLLDRQFYGEVKVKDATEQTVFGSSTVGGHIFTVPVDGRYKFELTGGGGGASGSGGGGDGGHQTGPAQYSSGGKGGDTGKGGDGANYGGTGAPAIAGSSGTGGGLTEGGNGGKGADGRGGGAGKKFTGEATLKAGDVLFIKIGKGGKGGDAGSAGGGAGKAGENGEDTIIGGAFWGTASGGSNGSGKTGGGSGSGKGGNGADGGAGGTGENKPGGWSAGKAGTKGGDGTGGSCTITILK